MASGDMGMAEDELDFDALVENAYRELPFEFRKACRDVLICTEDLAPAEVLKSLQLSDPYDLRGLYQGVELTRKCAFDLPGMPDKVSLYRLPIIFYAEANGLTLKEVVKHVLVHEIGHHFGFSDADMESIEFS